MDNLNDKIEVELDKYNLRIMLLGSTIFVVMGFMFVLSPATFLSIKAHSKAYIFIAGLAGIVFFGLVDFAILKKLLSKAPGLIISNDGISDNSNGLSVGFIPWSDIKRIDETVIANRNYIILIVINPQKIIERQKGWLKRRALKSNLKKYKAIAGFSDNTLKYNHDDLLNILRKKFVEYNFKFQQDNIRI